MRKLTLAGVVAIAAFIPLLMAPTGGYPSFPTFQGANINGNGGVSVSGLTGVFAGQEYITNNGSATLGLVDMSRSANSREWQLQYGGGTFAIQNCPDTLSGCTSTMSIAQTGAVSIPAPSGANAALALTGGSNSYTQTITASATSSQSYGEVINAGTTSSDNALLVQNQAGTSVYFKVRGDGQVSAGGATIPPVVSAIITSAQTRTSTVTLSCDAQLVVTAPTNNKTYSLRISFGFDNEGATTNGITFNVAATGTGALVGGTALIGLGGAVPAAGQGPVSIDPANTLKTVTSGTPTTATQTYSGLVDAIVSSGAGAATFCLNWSQAASVATPTRIDYGYITLTQLN